MGSHADTANGSGRGARPGAPTLTLLATPLSGPILRALLPGPQQQPALRRATGIRAQSTLRPQLRRLAAIGTIEKQRRNRFPGSLQYELSPAGTELIEVIDILEHWLSLAPGGPLALESSAGRAAIKALTDAWSSTMLRALAAGPMSLTALDKMIGSSSYPSLKRRLTALRLTGQAEAAPTDGASTPYMVTDWLRHGLAPLASATRWERVHAAADMPAIGRIDIEAALLLASPLLRLPGSRSGACRIGVEALPRRDVHIVGVTIEFVNGAATSCTTRLRADAAGWALAPPLAWLNAVTGHKGGQVEVGGDTGLARAVVAALRIERSVIAPRS